MDVFDRDEFKKIIDAKLAELGGRELISTSEVQDVLLDLRNTVLDGEPTIDPTPDFAPLGR